MSPNPTRPGQARSRLSAAWRWAAVLWALAIAFAPTAAWASDHADPIDPLNRRRLEGGITDLFVFPVTADGRPAFPFQRSDGLSLAAPDLSPRPALTDEQRSQITHMVVILCVRRSLTQTGSLRLVPYTYKVHMDLTSTVSYDDTPADHPEPPHDHSEGDDHDHAPRPSTSPASRPARPTGAEARARYGGFVETSLGIKDDVLIEIGFENDASVREFQVKGLKDPEVVLSKGAVDPRKITVWSGVRDDPFIFPAFFRTNVVAVVMSIPMTKFPEGQKDWLVWATSHQGNRQLDHVGRSQRTQNPRFELLNTLPPRDQVAAIAAEHESPGLFRDIALRLNFRAAFAYRAWDQVPDVMIFTTRHQAGFPNGRFLTDDVAAMLAQHGDIQLLELSHIIGGWPRQTTNDKPFLAAYPYLAPPWPDRDPDPPPGLSMASWAKLFGIALGLLLLLVLENWVVARWYHRRKLRRRYL